MAIAYVLSKLLSQLVALAYPAYASYKALRTRKRREIVPWLMFWIVLSIFNLVESIADLFVFWIPFYYELKFIFVLWLILPQTRGHIYIYKTWIHPTLRLHEEHIDATLLDVQSNAMARSTALTKQGLQLLQRVALEHILAGDTRTNPCSPTTASTAAPHSSSLNKVISSDEDEPLTDEEYPETPVSPTTRVQMRDHVRERPPSKSKDTSFKVDTDQQIQKIMKDLTSSDYL